MEPRAVIVNTKFNLKRILDSGVYLFVFKFLECFFFFFKDLHQSLIIPVLGQLLITILEL